MGHHISAVVLKGSYDRKFLVVFDLKAIRLTDELTLIPLDAAYVDHWSERLGLGPFGGVADFPLLNGDVVHHLLGYLSVDPLFAVIQTDYWGGRGSQGAVVYQGKVEVMKPDFAEFGPINQALRLLGVTRREGMDEFDTVGLGSHRNFSHLFEAY